MEEPRSLLGRYLDRPEVEIRHAHGYKNFSEQPREEFGLLRWLCGRAWLADEHTRVLFDLAASWLLQRNVLLPGPTVPERPVARVRDRTKRRLYRRLSGFFGIQDQTQEAVPARLSGAEMVRALNRLREVRSLGAGSPDLSGVPPVDSPPSPALPAP